MKTMPHYFSIPGVIRTVGPLVKQSHIQEVVNVVVQHFGITHDRLLSKSRIKDEVFKRHLAIWAVTKRTECTLHEIARYFDIDHCSVMHARNKVDGWVGLQNDDGREASKLLKKINQNLF